MQIRRSIEKNVQFCYFYEEFISLTVSAVTWHIFLYIVRNSIKYAKRIFYSILLNVLIVIIRLWIIIRKKFYQSRLGNFISDFAHVYLPQYRFTSFSSFKISLEFNYIKDYCINYSETHQIKLVPTKVKLIPGNRNNSD